MDNAPAPELPGDYYVANFHALAGFVVDTYADLLTADERSWYQSVCSLPEPSQRLYIRLLTRAGSSFRLSRLHYPEIDDVGQAATELAQSGLARCIAPDELSVLLACFTKPELLQRLQLQTRRSLSRVALCEHIADQDQAARLRFIECLQASERWISLTGHSHWILMQLCFFGNLYQDSREFVLQQLGTMRYESYALDSSVRAFTSREQIEAHRRYYECEALFDCTDQRNPDDLMQLARSLPQVDCERKDTHLQRRVDRLRNRIARQLERLSCTDKAQTLYQASINPPARERCVRILMARQQWPDATLLLRQMQEAPRNEPERLVAERLLNQCCKAQGMAGNKHRVFKPASSKLILRNTGERVEELARRFYAMGGECFHTENTLVNGVLGLFIWDIIFHPLPGVFFNPFQIAPSDFKEPEFRVRRAELLEDRFAELDNAAAMAVRVKEAYQRHHGKLNPLVRWHNLSPGLLDLALDRIAARDWQALFVRILTDTRENSSGLPDLVLFPEQGGYEFIEIKGPGDALQANQRRWMRYFDEHGIACRVVHVRYRIERDAGVPQNCG